MDFSVILVVPWGAICAFVGIVSFAVARRTRPRLIWPFLFVVLTSAPVFVGLPMQSEVWFWVSAMIGLAIWAAIGTVIGGLLGRFFVWTVRELRSD